MKSKLLALLATTLTAGVAALSAQTAPAATTPSYTLKLTPAFTSTYMFRGVKLGGPCFQPAVEFGSGDLVVGLWSSFPMNDDVPGVSDPEFDFYGSYTLKLNDATTLVPGYTWYMYPDADKSIGFYKSTFEPSLALNYTAGGITLTPKLYYDLVLKGPTAEFTAAYTIPLGQDAPGLGLSATYGTYKWTEAAENTTPSVKNWGDYWSVNAALPFNVTKNSVLTLNAGYVKGTNNYFKQGNAGKVSNSLAIGRPVFSIAYAITF